MTSSVAGELREVIEQLNGLYERTKARIVKDYATYGHPADPKPHPFEVHDGSYRPVLADMVVARANALAALAQLERGQ